MILVFSFKSGVVFQFTPLREGRRTEGERTPTGKANFNSRPCGRGDGLHGGGGLQGTISIHAPAGGRLNGLMQTAVIVNFNSRPCGRGDVAGAVIALNSGYFNSRPCGRGDRAQQRAQQQGKFQFTPLREGRLQTGQNLLQRLIISIHAPAGGAT